MVIIGQDRKLSTDIDFSEFSYSYTCIIIMFVLMGMTMIRKLGVFVKFNTYGVIFIFMIIIFIVGTGVKGLITTDYVFS